MPRVEIKEFQRRADEVASFLKSNLSPDTRVKIVTHTDADGISAASILARYLHDRDVPFHVVFSRPLRHDEVVELSKEDYDFFVFIDQGSAQVSEIHKHVLGEGRNVLILDHHPGEFPEHSKLGHLNPHACNLNGASDISAAGVVYSVVERLDKKFRPMVWLAVVGALGDRQEFSSGFVGINEGFVKRAMDLNVLRVGKGLKLIGRTQSPVVECLRLSIRPYLPGITGNVEACRELVKSLGIPPEGKIAELGVEREAGLRDALFARSNATLISEEFRHILWGPLYVLREEIEVFPAELHEYAAMLEACGELGSPNVGFAATMGDEASATDALALLKRYQGRMVEVLKWLEGNLDAFETTPKFRCIYVGREIDPKMVGEAISLAVESGLVKADRPVVGIAESNGELKVSARATRVHVARGVNLGESLRRAAASVGGVGGGHDVAAAARIPLTKRNEFIAALDETLPRVKEGRK